MDGWIKLHRKIVDREWYSDINVRILFIHLLLIVNHKPKNWKGIVIDAGEVITGYEILSKQCGMSVMQVRTSLNKLESSREINREVTGKGQRIKLLNYTKYQDRESEYNREITDKQQGSNSKVTTNKNDKNIKKERNISSTKIHAPHDPTTAFVSEQDSELEHPPLVPAPPSRRDDITELIEIIRQTADTMKIAYDKTDDRKFAKHICDAREFGDFAEKIGKNRAQLAVSVMKASMQINYRKGVCGGPKSIYQNYSEIYNDRVTKNKKQTEKKPLNTIATLC